MKGGDEMDHDFSDEHVAGLIAKFPDKYKSLVKRAVFQKGLGVPFELTFTQYDDLNEFLFMFDHDDFPANLFPDGFALGICAKCPQCGKLNMSGGMGFALMELNSRKVKEMKEKGGEIVNVCLTCQLDMLGPGGMRQMCEDTIRETNLIRGPWEEERKKTVH
ncbi:hypothetical protein ACFL2U_00865 [Patescibacteria group bacterium]